MACSSASICYSGRPATGGTFTDFRAGSTGVLQSACRRLPAHLRSRRLIVRSDLDSNVSDMRTNGKFIFLY